MIGFCGSSLSCMRAGHGERYNSLWRTDAGHLLDEARHMLLAHVRVWSPPEVWDNWGRVQYRLAVLNVAMQFRALWGRHGDGRVLPAWFGLVVGADLWGVFKEAAEAEAGRVEGLSEVGRRVLFPAVRDLY